MTVRASAEELLYRLQQGLPLTPRPFAVLGREVGWTEDEVVREVENLFRTGRARRLGAVFDVRRMGFKSALCAARVTDPARLAHVAEQLFPIAGITHCYERGWPAEWPADAPGTAPVRAAPNLWFTLAAPRAEFDALAEQVGAMVRPAVLHLLTARRRFKVEVIFGTAPGAPSAPVPAAPASRMAADTDETAAPVWTGAERRLRQSLEGHLAPAADLFRPAAEAAGVAVAEAAAILRHWQSAGFLRRVGLILHHRAAGFEANAMCVWRVPVERVEAAGAALAARSEVTHCYERIAFPEFPYNLYAMVHAARWPDLWRVCEDLTRAVGPADGVALASLREFKKSSMSFFSEEPGRNAAPPAQERA